MKANTYKGIKMNKKILLSVAASALLSTSAFAAISAECLADSQTRLITDKGHANITEESYNQNGMDVINFSSFKYVACINNNQSLSISDPLVRIDISDIEIPRSGTHTDTSGDNTSERFDKNGKGLLLSSIAQNISNANGVANDQKNDLEEHFKGLYLIDVDANGTAVTGNSIPFDNINAEAGKIYLNFSGDSSDSIINGHSYILSKSPNAVDEVDIDFKYVRGNQKMSLTTFSQTLDDNLQDSASFANITAFPPQFEVKCVRKFDGLINFENDRVSFVNPEHGDRIETVAGVRVEDNGTINGANITSDTVIDRDRMIFTIDNARNSDAATRYMGGHGTEFTFNIKSDNDNNSNKFGATSDNEWDYNLKIIPKEVTNTSATGNGTYTDTLLDGTPALDGNVTFAANKFTITHPLNKPIPAGLTAYQLDLVSKNGATPIRPVTFYDGEVDLEGGLTPNEIDTEDTASRTEVNHGGAVTDGDVENNYITNSTLESGTGTTDSFDGSLTNGGAAITRDGMFGRGDSSDAIRPAKNYTVAKDVGEWMDHSYIAQIAGVGHNPSVISRIFITNRSCADVTPIFKVIQNGKVQSVTNIGNYKNSNQSIEISVDSQNIYQLKDIVDAAVLEDTTGTITASGVYSIEIILPGVAEDFYVYAQSKNSDNTNTYDLPVYNTSARD